MNKTKIETWLKTNESIALIKRLNICLSNIQQLRQTPDSNISEHWNAVAYEAKKLAEITQSMQLSLDRYLPAVSVNTIRQMVAQYNPDSLVLAQIQDLEVATDCDECSYIYLTQRFIISDVTKEPDGKVILQLKETDL